MSYAKLGALFERMFEKENETKRRVELCATGNYSWYCHLRSVPLYHALADENGYIDGVPAWRWWKVAMVERFQHARKSERPECGARCRSGAPCKARRMVRDDGTLARRCRMHGGGSTGPRTAAGRAAVAESNRRRAKAGSR